MVVRKIATSAQALGSRPAGQGEQQQDQDRRGDQGRTSLKGTASLKYLKVALSLANIASSWDRNWKHESKMAQPVAVRPSLRQYSQPDEGAVALIADVLIWASIGRTFPLASGRRPPRYGKHLPLMMNLQNNDAEDTSSQQTYNFPTIVNDYHLYSPARLICQAV
jgi:hypothetical protein